MTRNPTPATRQFLTSRNLLLGHRTDLAAARARFHWPRPAEFNWALEWFDVIARGNERPALVLPGPLGTARRSFAGLSWRSDQVAVWLRSLGVRRGDRLLLMLGNRVALWETMLASIKLGAVVVPTYPTVGLAELADRMTRGGVAHVVADAAHTPLFEGLPGSWTPVSVGEPVAGWIDYRESRNVPEVFVPDGPTRADEPLFLYFTSGTTARPKLVCHTHASYPVGHLTGMYWNGIRPGDVHLNVSAPGWAKHAWSSFFAPWNAQAAVVALDTADPARIQDALVRHGVTTFCAPPGIWRELARREPPSERLALREAVSAGEPLDPATMARIRTRWGVAVRDGYGQTETTALVGNTPGPPPVPGSMGEALPGYRIAVIDPDTDRPARVGELRVRTDPRPVGLMTGYLDDPERTAEAFAGGWYRTGDLVSTENGRLHFLGRRDEVFKCESHRVSPVEIESLLLRHEAVAEAAVVATPGPDGSTVPKAYVVPRPGHPATAGLAEALLAHVRGHIAAEKRVRLLEFAESLPRTRSGKVRRVELRARAEASGTATTAEGDAMAVQETEPVPLVIENLFDVDELLATLPFRETDRAGREGVEMYPLYGSGEDGPSAALVRYRPGAAAPPHLHPGNETVLVLAGTLHTEHGVFPAGSLQVLPPGSTHAPCSPEGATMLIVWERPVRAL